MGITLLIVGVAVAITATYVVATRTDTVLPGEITAVGLGDPGSETLAGGHLQPRPRTDWELTTVTDLTDAEELLDCLEAQGFMERELVVLGNSCFAVRWR